MNQGAFLVILFATAVARGQTATAPARPLPPQPLAPPSATSAVAPTSANPMAGAVAIDLATGGPISASQWAAAASNGVPVAVVQTNALAIRPLPAQAPARSNITPVQMQNINQIDIALNSLEISGRDPAEQQRGLLQALQAAPIARVRPGPESIARLGSTLVAVLPTLRLTAPQRRQLAIDLNLAINSGSLAPAEAERVISDARSVLQGSTINNAQGVENLMSNLSLIVSDAQAALARQNASARPPATTEAGVSGQSQTGGGSGSSPRTNPEPK